MSINNPKLRSQNMSIMLTDIQGYSTTSAQASREEMVTLIRRHKQLMSPVISFYGGVIVKTIGDAFLCTFVSSTDAVICAIIIQMLLRDYNQKQMQTTQQLIVRIVVHSGCVTFEGNDILGDAVNITARMEALPCFPGGTIGISEATYLLMDRGEITVEKIGPQEMKGLPEPVTVYRVPLEQQKLVTLPPNLLDLVEEVLNGKEPPTESDQPSVWQTNVGTFLRERNWGQNLEKFGEKVGQQLGDAQKQLANTFSQKTVLERADGRELKDATLVTRLKCFGIDGAVVLIGTIVMNVAFWPIQKLFLDQYNLGLIGALFWYPTLLVVPLVWLYFTVLWKLKGASLGQIAGHSAVVMEDGSPLSWGIAAGRAGLFVASTLLFGLGAITIFQPEKKTIFDKICNTRVVEEEPPSPPPLPPTGGEGV